MSLQEPVRLPHPDELPDSDGVPMELDLDRQQATIYLIQPLREYLERTGLVAFVSGNSFVYYEPGKKAVGPDVYVVNGGVPNRQKKWVVWAEENRYPTLIVELLSPSTERQDRGRKLRLYRDVFHTPDYVLYRTDDAKLEVYRLVQGVYVRVLPDASGRVQCVSLPLMLGVHSGWLRWFTRSGELLRTGKETTEQLQQRLEQEQQRADQERQRAEQERRRAETAEAELRSLRGEA